MSEFFERLRSSGLVDDAQLHAALAHVGSPTPDPRPLARYLIRHSLLTKWQCQQVLEGRYKGFFLGKYKLLEPLGRGGMSMVYVAEHVSMQRKVALKLLPKNRTQDGSFVERFRREARSSAALNHPHIVRAYDFDVHDQTFYLVMELVDGQNLQELVKAEHPLTCPRIAGLIAQAAFGLQHAHDRGFVHRDVKPANVLVDKSDQVKILDLGLAMGEYPDQASLTLENDERLLGTADYLAPEQALDCHAVDHRADIYALGGTLFYALTGQPPYPDGSIAQKIAQHQSAAPPDPREFRTDCPERLAELCLHMMQKSPAARVGSAREVAEILREVQAASDSENQGAAASAPKDNLIFGDRIDESTAEFDPSDESLADDGVHTIQTAVRIIPHSTTQTSRLTRRRHRIPWWLWLSMLGLLSAAVWMWQKLGGGS